MEVRLENFEESVAYFLRRCGYAAHSGYGEEQSFVRRLTRNDYPRFHVYAKVEGRDLLVNLHLDQKKASYPGAHAHNAEYEGSLVLEEGYRIKEFHPPQHSTSR